MWLQRITFYLLQHRFLAIVLTFVSTFIPIIGVVGIVYAAFVTLRKGLIDGAILTIAATIPYMISFYLSGNVQGAALPIVLWAAVGVAVASNLLTWIFAAMLRRGATWSLMLQIAALLGVLVVSVIHLAYPSVVDWWGGQLQAYYKQATAMASLIKAQVPISNDVQLEAISITKQYATGLMIGAILFNALLQLTVARWWQTLMFSPGILRKELYSIRLSQLAGVLFAISLVLSYMGNSVVLDIMPILYMLFCAAGLSLIHCLLKQTNGSGWFWLCVLYIALILSWPIGVLLVAILALLDIWLNVRKRFSKAI